MRQSSPVRWLTDDRWRALPILERAIILAHVYTDILSVREVGFNAGKHVEMFLRSVRLGKGFPWCAAFVTYVLIEAGWDTLPKNPASVCSWFEMGEDHGAIVTDPSNLRRGDLIGWCNRRRWRGHMGVFVSYDAKHNTITSLEGNTNQVGSREGDGCYRKVRKWRGKLRGIALSQF